MKSFLILSGLIFVYSISNTPSCSIGSDFIPISFSIDNFPTPPDGYLMPRVEGHFKVETKLTGFKINLFDEAGNEKTWSYSAVGNYPPGQVSFFGDWIQVENYTVQAFNGEIVLMNGSIQVACYSFSFFLTKV